MFENEKFLSKFLMTSVISEISDFEYVLNNSILTGKCYWSHSMIFLIVI